MFNDFKAKFGGRTEAIQKVVEAMLADGVLTREPRVVDRKGHVKNVYTAGPAL